MGEIFKDFYPRLAVLDQSIDTRFLGRIAPRFPRKTSVSLVTRVKQSPCLSVHMIAQSRERFADALSRQNWERIAPYFCGAVEHRV